MYEAAHLSPGLRAQTQVSQASLFGMSESQAAQFAGACEFDLPASGDGSGTLRLMEESQPLSQSGGVQEAQQESPLSQAATVHAAAQAFPTGSAASPQSAQPGRPLRVIHVCQHLVRAGIEMWLKALIEFSDPRQLRFERCIVTGPFADAQVIREMPVPIELGGEASVRRAARDCDVLLASGPPELAMWLGEQERPPCVFIAHGDGRLTRQILEQVSPVVDHVVAVSRRAQQHVCHGFPTTVIYNGLDTTRLARSAPRGEVRQRLGLSEDDFVVGSMMRLSSEKRPELLVEAMAELPRHCKLLLAGWGPLEQKLLELANRVAPCRCVIVPAVRYIGDFYSAMDVFCLPSSSEGFGLATLEAMFCGVPVITTNTGFAPELLREGVQYVQCQGTAASVAASVRLLLDQPRWAAGLADEGRRAAEQFGFASRMCRQYEQLLWQLAQPKAGRP